MHHASYAYSHKLRICNIALSILVACIALYVFVLPWADSLAWWIKHSAPLISTAPALEVSAEASIPADNTLVIPRIDLRTPIHDGATKATLAKGIWHQTNNTSPESGGNMVLAGHRFTYKKSAAILYHLDKVQMGDNITVYWNKKRYDYKVVSIKTVDPNDETVTQNTTESMLTIYTCTPLWSSKQRLVVQASLISGDIQ